MKECFDQKGIWLCLCVAVLKCRVVICYVACSYLFNDHLALTQALHILISEILNYKY